MFHQSLFKVPSITMVFLFMLLGAPESRAQDSNFFVGTNYAWTININQRGDSGFAVDFGGHRAANKTGVSARRSRLEQDFSQMQRAGIKVVRWWVFPKFFGDGVQFDANGDPTGLGGTTVEDIKAAIDVAAKYDLQIMFCLFSFDNFNLYDRYPKLSTFIRSDRQEWLLINKVIKPFVSHAVQHAQAIGSPSTIHSWDIINEPDWAIQRSDPQDSSGLDFEPCEPFDYFDRQSGRPYNYCYGQRTSKATDNVSLRQMEDFIVKAAQGIREVHGQASVTVGWASSKWAPLWSSWLKSHLTFYQIHFYQWVDKYLFPYDTPISQQPGLSGKPVVMGEHPVVANGTSHLELLNTWKKLGYSGAMAWHFADVNDGLRDEPTPINYSRERYLNDIRGFLDRSTETPINPTVVVYRFAGSAACGRDNSISLERARNELGGITPIRQYKLNIPCGSQRGIGNCFEIPSEDLARARNLGFLALNGPTGL